MVLIQHRLLGLQTNKVNEPRLNSCVIPRGPSLMNTRQHIRNTTLLVALFGCLSVASLWEPFGLCACSLTLHSNLPAKTVTEGCRWAGQQAVKPADQLWKWRRAAKIWRSHEDEKQIRHTHARTHARAHAHTQIISHFRDNLIFDPIL